MFIKNLRITNGSQVIRDMNFENGLNLIIDDTPTDNKKQTGNNVGKTTVLKLIYFCLGGDGKEIYTDEENRKAIYKEVKDFLIDKEVLVTLTLVENLISRNSKKIVIERDFLPGNRQLEELTVSRYYKKNLMKN